MPGHSPFQTLKFAAAPSLFLILLWIFYLEPTSIDFVCPRYFGKQRAMKEVLPLYPKTMNEAWKLAQLELRLSIAEAQQSDRLEEKILHEAASLVSREYVLASDLHNIPLHLELVEEERGLLSRIWGMFTFINLLWFGAICGITISFLPALLIIAGPLADFFVNLFGQVIIPLLRALTPLYEYGVYYLCFWFIVEGTRAHSETGFFISLTGLLGIIPAFIYTHYLHPEGAPKKPFGEFTFLFFMTTWAPFAVHYNSVFIGMLAVMAFYAVLGFSVVCTGCCYLIGFNDKVAMERVTVTSLMLVILAVLTKIYHVRIIYLLPFVTPVNIMGTITYFLSLLITSSAWNFSQNDQYHSKQVIMVCSLTMAIFIGSVFSIPAILNTGCVFAVLYGMEKSTELPGWKHYFFLYVFAFSIVIWRISLFLSSRPDIIVNMFDSSYLLR